MSLATSAAINAAKNNYIPEKGVFKLIKGTVTIKYNDYDIIDYKNVEENTIGFIRFRKSININNPSEDIVYFFTNSSHVEEICEYIQERMQIVRNSKTKSSIDKESIPDEILKYKKLLDMGAITQKEYDKKKKELLDL